VIFLILSLLAAPAAAGGETVHIKVGGLKIGEVAQAGFRVTRAEPSPTVESAR